MSRSITVYCSSSNGVHSRYFDAARQLGDAIAARNWTLVYGGNHVGPMGALADGARARRGRVVGITPKHFIDAGHGDDACDELVVVENMRRRKELLEHRGDAFVVLPGGIGTLEELTEVLVSRHLGFHQKPIILLNVADFWNPLVDLLREGLQERFIRPGTLELMQVHSTVDSCMQHLDTALRGQA
jgi:hypothetical protein